MVNITLMSGHNLAIRDRTGKTIFISAEKNFSEGPAQLSSWHAHNSYHVSLWFFLYACCVRTVVVWYYLVKLVLTPATNMFVCVN